MTQYPFTEMFILPFFFSFCGESLLGVYTTKTISTAQQSVVSGAFFYFFVLPSVAQYELFTPFFERVVPSGDFRGIPFSHHNLYVASPHGFELYSVLHKVHVVTFGLDR